MVQQLLCSRRGCNLSNLILLADDHLPDVVLVKEALRAAGVAFEMEVLSDGEAVHRRLLNDPQKNKPDLIVLDIHLTRITGLELLEKLRAQPAFDGTPVAILTSSLSPTQRDQAMRLKADAFISKPTHLDQFMSEVGSTLQQLLNRKARRVSADPTHEE